MTKNLFACFVTGTDTEVGKTLISCALLHALVQRGWLSIGMKPVAAGTRLVDGIAVNEDAELLAAAGNLALPRSLTTPFLLQEPAAPHVAASLEGIAIDRAHILTCFHELIGLSEALVVEGVGGFIVPLGEGFNTADLAAQMALPVILVVGVRLGCLNHALLSAEAICSRGLTLAGWVANLIEPEMPHAAANIASLQKALPAPLLGVVPYLSSASGKSAASHLDPTLIDGWPTQRR